MALHPHQRSGGRIRTSTLAKDPLRSTLPNVQTEALYPFTIEVVKRLNKDARNGRPVIIVARERNFSPSPPLSATSLSMVSLPPTLKNMTCLSECLLLPWWMCTRTFGKRMENSKLSKQAFKVYNALHVNWTVQVKLKSMFSSRMNTYRIQINHFLLKRVL